MLLCSSSQPDRNHMLGATWNGRSLFVFARDLENQAERIDFDPSAATATLAEQ
jgi:hypothetical protein